ncbi:MAG: hypothetical protein WCH34_16335 [Bacteroidota bacterium]
MKNLYKQFCENKNYSILLFIVILLFIIAVINISSGGIRGTDQYWYIADVESLMHGKNKTNDLYSGLIMGDSSYLLLRPFIHNVLSLYLVLPFAFIFGSYTGWVVLNSISVLIAAFMILWTINRITGNLLYSLYGFSIFLLNPIILWHTTQPLAEASVTPFVAAVVAICASAQLDFKRTFGIIIILVLANMVRGVFFPLLILMPFVYFYLNYSKKSFWKSLFLFLMLIVTTILLIKFQLIIFGESPFGLKDLLMNALPGGSNMDFYLFEKVHSIDWALVSNKFINSIQKQLWSGDQWFLFYLSFNIMSILLLYKICNQNSLSLQVIVFALMLLMIHIATVLIHQNQFRYMLIPFPAVLVGSVLVIEKNFNLSDIVLKRILFIVIIGLFALSLPLAIKSRSDAQKDFVLRQQIERKVSHIVGKTGRIILCGETGYSIKAAYTLRPRVIIEFPSNGSTEYFSRVINRSHPDWLFCDINVMKRLFFEMKWEIPKIVSELQYGGQKVVLVALPHR